MKFRISARPNKFTVFFQPGKMIVLFVIVAFFLASYSCSKKSVLQNVSTEKSIEYDTAAFNYLFVEAVKMKILGNSGDALKYIEQCLKMNPNSDAACFQAAQILLGSGNTSAGKKYAIRAYEKDPDNFWYIMMLAGASYQERDLDSATMFYEKAVKLFPEKEDVKITLANLFSEKREFSKATEIYKSLDEKYGTNPSSSAGTVKNLIWEGKYDEALTRAEMLVAEYPDEIIFNGLLAEIYKAKGNSDKAMEVFEGLIKRNPGNAQTQLALCDFLLEEKKYDDLLALINSVILNEYVAREDKIALFGKMIENKELVKFKTQPLLVSVMVLEASFPGDNMIEMVRPEIMVSAGMIDKAEERLIQITTKNPANYFAWEKLLFVYLEKEDFINLEKNAEICSRSFNRSFIAKILYATAAAQNGKLDVAIEELRKAEILAGDNKELGFQVKAQKADTYYRMKDYERAFFTFGEALKMNNSDLTLLNNYAYYLSEQNIRLKEAEVMAKKVTELEPENNTYLDTYAWVLFKRGKLRQAEDIMNKIFQKSNSGDAEFYEHYGYIAAKMKNCSKAIEAWKKAIELDNRKQELVKQIENCKK